jgi:hypothetical protein
MAYSFKINSGKRAFGVFSESLNASQYTYNKKAQTTYCLNNICKTNTKVGTESNLLLFKSSNRLNNLTCKKLINNANLDINLITKLNLTDIPVISDFSGNVGPTTISTSVAPYLHYNIDPSGYLFGNSICGINNYVAYMQYNI